MTEPLPVLTPARGSLTDDTVAQHLGRPARVVFVDSLPAHVEDPVPVRDLVDIARRLAHRTVERFEHEFPEVLSLPFATTDLKDALRVAVQLRLLTVELIPMLAFLKAFDGGERAIWMSTVHGDDLASVLGCDPPVMTGPEPGECVARLHRQFRRGDAEGEQRTRSVLEKAPDAAAVIVTGGPGDSVVLRHVAEAVGATRPLIVMGKNSREETVATVREVGALVGAHTIEASPDLLRPTKQRTRELAAAWDHAIRRTACSAGAVGCIRSLSLLAALQRHAAGFERLFREHPPTLVAGSWHRSPLGGVLAAVTSSAAVVDVQHGTLVPFGVADAMHADMLLAWNDYSVDVLKSEGGGAAAVAVVGNPLWDALRDLGSRKRPRQGSIRVGFFPQPPKGPMLTRGMLDSVVKMVLELLHERPEIDLVIKERARSTTVRSAFAELEGTGRMQVVEHQAGSLEAVLGDIDVAASVHSTVLLDALAAGIPAVSIIPGGALQGVEMDVLQVAPVARDVAELSQALDRLVRAGPPSLPHSVLPRFEQPFSERVAEALQSLS